ncbi:hypothetical protein BCR42DRAFT_398576 [Absidia repens]|uniref:Uncharacterized protein n=1 Tax=Absidia repens TaxID=90262 RepID=A0A1X2HXP2_9FUNG|nr:hypothetical protein BCR42DRAFT_398576 [Absidia repens]
MVCNIPPDPVSQISNERRAISPISEGIPVDAQDLASALCGHLKTRLPTPRPPAPELPWKRIHLNDEVVWIALGIAKRSALQFALDHVTRKVSVSGQLEVKVFTHGALYSFCFFEDSKWSRHLKVVGNPVGQFLTKVTSAIGLALLFKMGKKKAMLLGAVDVFEEWARVKISDTIDMVFIE